MSHPQNSLPESYLAIDEHGLIRIADQPVKDSDPAHEILKNLFIHELGSLCTKFENQSYFVEAFDQPLIVQKIESLDETETNIRLHCQYSWTEEADLHTLQVDEWDRFLGKTLKGIPFVLSARAQNQLFELCDEFDDESITYNETMIEISDWLPDAEAVEDSEFWSQAYLRKEARWDLKQASPILTDMLDRLRLPRSKVLVLGCGPGHDAAFFAEHGHIVTAVDISSEALNLARSNYPNANIQWIQKDIFDLNAQEFGQFDFIFEHTCFCAINPYRRKELVKKWIQLLAPEGSLMGIFFAMERRNAAPFGGSEWEIRQRLRKNFQFLFWGRWRNSIQGRQGKELFVYAKKMTL